MNCAIMALMHLMPWASPDGEGKIWANPFTDPDWLETFRKKLGIGKRGTGGAGLEPWVCTQFLNDNDLSSKNDSSLHKGFPIVDALLDTVEWYDEAPLVLIVLVEYSHLPGGRYGPHAVTITGIEREHIFYHDPALNQGSHMSCDKKQFERAHRLYGFGTYRRLSPKNLMVIWDQDRVPNILEALLALKNSKSKKRSLDFITDPAGHKSHFTVFRDPSQLLRKLWFK
jgi:hypothetical protein